jgi:phosphomevalonate kinase
MFLLYHLLTSACSYSDADLGLNRNVFIETALGYAVSYIAAVWSPQITPASITILADNDYYSTSDEVSNGTTNGTGVPKSRFHNFGLPLSKAHKTGLGSSAALVTAFIAALLSYYLPQDHFDLSTETSKRRLHNLAQAAHCAAQGKVGSGFDVASAVYGSCLYRRFSPIILASSADPGSENFATALMDLVNETDESSAWDTEIHRDAVKVPKGLRLVMCDVSCGSQTPGMVKKVLAWRKENPQEADAIWTDLHEANESLAMEMKAMAEQQEFGLERLRTCFNRIRKGIRVMSERSGVPIEPASQTELLDACEAVSGVIGGVVPGAGGYDAISLLIEDKEDTVAELEKLLAEWKFKGEDGMVDGSGRVSMLGVREEMEGVKMEKWKNYEQWVMK